MTEKIQDKHTGNSKVFNMVKYLKFHSGLGSLKYKQTGCPTCFESHFFNSVHTVMDAAVTQGSLEPLLKRPADHTDCWQQIPA